jgi:hypothetical protein
MSRTQWFPALVRGLMIVERMDFGVAGDTLSRPIADSAC